MRNPYDRIYSAYRYLKRVVGHDGFPDAIWATHYLSRFETFEDFILEMGRSFGFRKQVLKHIHFRPQTHWIRLPESKEIKVDFIGKFENLEHDFKKVCQELDINDVILPQKRSNKAKRNYEEVYYFCNERSGQ